MVYVCHLCVLCYLGTICNMQIMRWCVSNVFFFCLFFFVFVFFFIIQGATIYSFTFVGNEFGDIVKYCLAKNLFDL